MEAQMHYATPSARVQFLNGDWLEWEANVGFAATGNLETQQEKAR